MDVHVYTYRYVYVYFIYYKCIKAAPTTGIPPPPTPPPPIHPFSPHESGRVHVLNPADKIAQTDSGPAIGRFGTGKRIDGVQQPWGSTFHESFGSRYRGRAPARSRDRSLFQPARCPVRPKGESSV